jgi:hypothetical protein
MPSTKAVRDGLLLRQSEAGSQWCVQQGRQGTEPRGGAGWYFFFKQKLFSFFYLFRQNLVALAGHHRQIFWIHQIDFFPLFHLIMELPQEDPPLTS